MAHLAYFWLRDYQSHKMSHAHHCLEVYHFHSIHTVLEVDLPVMKKPVMEPIMEQIMEQIMEPAMDRGIRFPVTVILFSF